MSSFLAPADTRIDVSDGGPLSGPDLIYHAHLEEFRAGSPCIVYTPRLTVPGEHLSTIQGYHTVHYVAKSLVWTRISAWVCIIYTDSFLLSMLWSCLAERIPEPNPDSANMFQGNGQTVTLQGLNIEIHNDRQLRSENAPSLQCPLDTTGGSTHYPQAL